eukprot:SAG31_NODE_29_length_32663_cov_14.779695_13_plen_454_part_00
MRVIIEQVIAVWLCTIPIIKGHGGASPRGANEIMRGPQVLETTFEDSHGGLTSLYYNMEFRHDMPGLVNLDSASEVLDVSCSPDTLKITVTEFFEHDSEWAPGWILVGGARFLCNAKHSIGADGSETHRGKGSFYREIVSLSRTATHKIEVVTKDRQLHHLFNRAHVKFSFKPGAETIAHAHKRIAASASKMDTVFSFRPNETGFDHSQRHRRQLHEWDVECPGGSIICNPVPWDLFGYNYGGNGRAQRPKISLFHSQRQTAGTSYGFDYQASGSVEFDCLDCYVHLGVQLDFELKFTTSWTGTVNLERFLLQLTGDLSGNMHLHAHAEAEFSATRKITILQDQRLGSITIPLAGVPLRIEFKGGLDAEVSFNARASGDADFAVSYSRSVVVGSQYDGHGFSDLHQMYGPGYQRSGPSYTFAGDADLRATLIPEIAIVIYNVWPIGEETCCTC